MNTLLKQTIRADAYRYSGSSGRGPMLSAFLHHPGFRYGYYLRKVAHYKNRQSYFGAFPYIYHRILLHHYRFKYGFDISPQTQIGPGLFIGHFGGVVISPFAILGANVNGNDALIAPGAYVNFDVAEMAVALGNPGQIVSYTGSAGYVNHTWPGAGNGEL